jgi:hypothetical protein
VEVVEWASNVLLAIGYVGVPAGVIAAVAFAVPALPFAEGRRWYGHRQRELWSAWRDGTISRVELRVGFLTTLVRPAWRSLLVTVPSFLSGLGLGLISGTVTWAS